MTMNPESVIAYVGLGANLGDPPAQLDAALVGLQAQPRIVLQQCSHYWRSKAVGPQPQDDYCNAACRVSTTLTPDALLEVLQALEDAAGRTRDTHWGPRTLDLDLLHVDGVRCATSRLTLPHPWLARRPFVLVPLAEVAPGLTIPGIGPISSLAAHCDHGELWPWQGVAPLGV